MSASLTLAERLDSPAAETLARDLTEARGGGMQIDAAAVTFCGALALQLLHSAHRQWLEDGQPFEVVNPSKDLTEACTLLGFNTENVGIVQNTGDNS